MARLNFPDPNVTTTYTEAGITWTYNATLGVWSAETVGLDGAAAAIGTVPPTAIAVAGDLWWNESDNSGRLFIYTGDEWVDASPVGVLQEVADAIYLSKTQDDTTSGQLTATGGFVGDLAGDVTGNVTGDVSGSVTGNLFGTATNCSRSVIAGDGLTGGGELDSNVTLNVVGGDGITAGADSVAVDSTVVRTSGNQTISNDKTFNNNVWINGTLSVRTAIDVADNDVIRFGSGDDVEFFFNGSNFYTDLNAGDWYIRDGTANRFVLNDDGSLLAYGTASQMNTGFSVARGIGSTQKISFTNTSGGNNLQGEGAKDMKYFNLGSGYGHKFYTAFSTSNTEQKERFRVDNSGNVYVLDQAGDSAVTAKLTSTGRIIRDTSDVSLKKDIEDLPEMSDIIKGLRPRKFKWRDEDMGINPEYGFIAQEVQESLADAVRVNSASDDRPELLSVHYQALTAGLTKALQESIARIETLESEVEELKNGGAN